MTSLPGILPSALPNAYSLARRSEAILRWFLILTTFVLLAAAYRAGLAAGLNSYIGPHAGGAFLSSLCIVATKWLTGVGNYVCLNDVSNIITGLGLTAGGPNWPGYLADREFLDRALRLLFERPHWVVPSTTSGPPYNGVRDIGSGQDAGEADFVNLAFRIFGPAVESLYSGYWFVCFASYLLFAIAYCRTVVPLVFLAAAAAVQYFIFSSDIFWSASHEWAAGENAHLHGPAGARFLSSLCVVPALHYLCATWRREPLHWREAVLLGLQGMVIFLALQQRSTVYWVVVAAILFAALHWVFPHRHTDVVTKRRCTLILVELLTVVVLCKACVAMATHPGLRTGGFMTSHSVWSAVFYSMQSHPDWKTRYSAEFEHNAADGVAAFAWQRYVANHPSEQGKAITSVFVEEMTRKALVKFVKHDPQYVLEVYFLVNTKIIYGTAKAFITGMAKGVPTAFPIVLIVFGVAVGIVSSLADMHLLMLSLPRVAFLCLISCLPNWATVVMSTSLTDFLVLLLIVVVMGVVALGAAGGFFLRRFFSGARSG